MTEFAVVEEHVRVGVGRDREGPLADVGADQGPRLTLAVPEADPTVAQVVRRPAGRSRRTAGACDRGPQALLDEAWEDRTLAWRESREDDGEEISRKQISRKRDPAAAPALLDRALAGANVP